MWWLLKPGFPWTCTPLPSIGLGPVGLTWLEEISEGKTDPHLLGKRPWAMGAQCVVQRVWQELEAQRLPQKG
jgi:hypothetical protein